ncbi:MAG: T9SS type A sorting domain-containing protein [Ignavibacteria bacterium]|nr:T9SS type A sorting domain-containing protein [Ignavibacteria bacterium]
MKTLVNEYREAGYYKAVFDGSGLASGIYFYKLSADNFNQTKKLSLVK